MLHRKVKHLFDNYTLIIVWSVSMGSMPKIIPTANIATVAKSNIAATVKDDARRFMSIQREILFLYLPTIYAAMLDKSQVIAMEGKTMIAIVKETLRDSQNIYVPTARPADKSRADPARAASTAPVRGAFLIFRFIRSPFFENFLVSCICYTDFAECSLCIGGSRREAD